jgi:hypothetical protein
MASSISRDLTGKARTDGEAALHQNGESLYREELPRV